MIDILLLAILGIVTWCVASEGAWGAGFIFVSVLLAALLAMNFFEPLATFMGNNVIGSGAWQQRWDSIALVGLFVGFVFLFREVTVRIAPAYMQVHPLVHEIGRWGFAALTGYITMAFLLTALHTTPLPREFAGFTPERKNLFGVVAPDRQWLGFTQYVSEKSMRNGALGHIFDGPEYMLPQHENQIWPSFPIRYASRRASGAGAAAPPPVSKEKADRSF
ncbi:Colicin V production protein [Gimesia panareensis]|uniref:Colicin V production protein n=1 Tax=Gimesia panareensis TaxID=2527978 RepID=A0A517Q027_9PLAN|nr:CvpA family protein [Gimesia panareensis]QDT24968.1 Colicin V production protein [Gimesia panareensis]